MMSNRTASVTRRAVDLLVRLGPLVVLSAWLPYLLFLGSEAETIAAQAHYGWFAVDAMQRAAGVAVAGIALVWGYLVLPAGVRGVFGALAATAALVVVLGGAAPTASPKEAAKGRVNTPDDGDLSTLPTGEKLSTAKSPTHDVEFVQHAIARDMKSENPDGPGSRERVYKAGLRKAPLGNERVHWPTMQADLRLAKPWPNHRAFCRDPMKRFEPVVERLLAHSKQVTDRLEARLGELRSKIQELVYSRIAQW